MTQLTVLVPALDEGGTLDAAAERILAALADEPVEVQLLFVDDGSSDDTWAHIEGLARRHPEIRGLALSRNFGKESAIVAGLDHVDADAVVVMDADMQHPPEVIPAMLAAWRGGAKIVHAVKRDQGLSLLRKVGTSVFYGVTRRLSGLAVHGSSDFKLLDRQVVDVYQQEIRERNRFFRLTAEWVGFQRAYVPFDVPTVEGRTSRWSLPSLLRLALRGLTTFSALPLQLPTLLGGLLLSFGIVASVLASVEITAGADLAGALLVVSAVLLTGGLVLVCMGILGEYVATIHEEVKRRPLYVVERDTAPAGPRTRDGGADDAATDPTAPTDEGDTAPR